MSTLEFTGSCLCGEVSYKATGEAQRFFHCHCKRCRKATGTGHASNLFVKGTLDWLSGEEQVKSYKVPEAERFGNSFCTNCGARLPKFIEAAGIVFIPAGSLDVEPGLAPQARIFASSRADWSCDETGLQTFEEYPV